ncbi:insertion element IS2 transposase InsD [Klebsiella pneumoniae]|nr:insertion element IS2 transposase InsD [Klebsiella pneumoniae]
MLGAVEKRFGRQLPAESLKWLTDNGSAYRAHETRAFARMLGLEPCTTAVRSPESRKLREDDKTGISIMPKPDSRMAVINLAVAFSHYNEHHPHSALGYRSPREYIRRKLSQP